MTSRRPAHRVTGRVPAEHDPVAQVMVDVSLPHLDRSFDYLVSSELDEAVRAGSRVRVRFAGRLVDGFVLARTGHSEHSGRLAFLERVTGDIAPLTEQTMRLCRAVADRWAGTFADVVRLAVPPRHAKTEADVLKADTDVPDTVSDQPATAPNILTDTAHSLHGWDDYPNAAGFARALAEGGAPRAVWTALAGEAWPQRLAQLAKVASSCGRGVVYVVPDARDLARLDAAVIEALGPGQHVCLTAELGPAARYRAWLAVRRGDVQVAIGTRSAGFAPVHNLGLVGIWDDGDDLHSEPRAPYPHLRDVLVLRSSLEHTAMLIGSFSRTLEAAYLVESGWSHEITAPRAVVRARSARVSAAGDDAELARDSAAGTARLPSVAIRAARAALAKDLPVLVQVPRRGYLPSLACARDRSSARCGNCGGPLSQPAAGGVISCRWCARPATDWRCPHCGGTRIRAVVIGAVRTADEFGRTFPGVPVLISQADRVRSQVPARAALVIATPGAEPQADEGYGAALLLDGWLNLSRPELNAEEEALRRWFNAAALVRHDGEVVLSLDASLRVVQALLRWDAPGYAERELADRRELRFPPYARLATVTGSSAGVAQVLELLQLPPRSEIIGSVELDTASTPGVATGPAPEQTITVAEPLTRAMLRCDRGTGSALAQALKSAAVLRSARKSDEVAKIQLDPPELF